jgi:hypothetical protein
MNDPNKGAGRVSNLTDEARARGAASTRLNALFKMETVLIFGAVIDLHLRGVWRGRSLRAKAQLLANEGDCTPWGFYEWSAVQVSRIEAKARHLVAAFDAGELDRERVYELIDTPQPKGFAPPEFIDGLFERIEALREAVEKQSE